MNPLGINLWNWCAGLSEECLGLPEKVAPVSYTHLDVYKRQVPKRTLADDEAFRRALSAMLDEGKKNE